MKFKGICLITKDVDQLKNFYQHILPVEIEEDSDDRDLTMPRKAWRYAIKKTLQELKAKAMTE